MERWQRQIDNGAKNKLHYYDCICDCGKQTTVQKQALLSGHIQSCGCTKFNNVNKVKDLTGQKFNRLTVLGRDVERDMKDKESGNKVRVHWLCDCDCGVKNISVDSYQLKSGHTKSCGCLQSEITAKRNIRDSTKVNNIEICDDYIKLYNDDTTDYFIVDKNDYEYIKKWYWKKDKKGYWNTNAKISDYDKGKCILRVHQEIAKLKYGEYNTKELFPDHLSRDKSDNTRKNLILKTNAENTRNRNLSSVNTSGKTGVSQKKDSGRYYAYITVDYKTINLGTYGTYEEAVEVRKQAELKYGFTCDDVFPEQDVV